MKEVKGMEGGTMGREMSRFQSAQRTHQHTSDKQEFETTKNKTNK